MRMKPSRIWIGAAVCSWTTVMQAGTGPIDGIWEIALAGNTHMIALVERADGRRAAGTGGGCPACSNFREERHNGSSLERGTGDRYR